MHRRFAVDRRSEYDVFWNGVMHALASYLNPQYICQNYATCHSNIRKQDIWVAQNEIILDIEYWKKNVLGVKSFLSMTNSYSKF